MESGPSNRGMNDWGLLFHPSAPTRRSGKMGSSIRHHQAEERSTARSPAISAAFSWRLSVETNSLERSSFAVLTCMRSRVRQPVFAVIKALRLRLSDAIWSSERSILRNFPSLTISTISALAADSCRPSISPRKKRAWRAVSISNSMRRVKGTGSPHFAT